MKVAAIDLGTNTFLCLIADVSDGLVKKIYFDESRVVRIGEGVHQSRRFIPQALARAEKTLKEFSEIIKKHNVTHIKAVATSAARDVSNGDELIKIGAKYNIPIEVISGKEEAEMTFRGLVSDRTNYEGVVGVDIGGGSTELVQMTDQNKIVGQSFDIGCLRLNEMFVSENPIPENEILKMKVYAKKVLSAYKNKKTKEVIAVAGTPTTLAAMEQGVEFSIDKIHNYKLSLKTIKKWQDKLAKLSLEERAKIKGLDSGRADIIVTGAVILSLCAEFLNVSKVTVSVRGIRYGLALKMSET